MRFNTFDEESGSNGNVDQNDCNIQCDVAQAEK